jgi:O-antigen/teichoic acid export membrane protein
MITTGTSSGDAAAISQTVWKRNPVRHNLLANLGGKGLTLIISLICVPIYIRFLGIGGYGLIGIWMTLETVANIIDLGLSPTITREMAACSTRPDGAQEARDLVRTLEIGYWLIGVVIGGVIIACASPIAVHWLSSTQLPPATLHSAIILIGFLILSRWPITFYIGGLNGLERQVLLSIITTGYSYLRSLGSVLILYFVSPTIFAFFVFQIIINVFQTIILTVSLWHCLPSGQTPRIRHELLRGIWRFAGGNTALTLIWLITSSLDKLIVSAMLPLEVFGYYTLGSRIALCLSSGSQSLFSVFFPVFSREAAANNESRLADLYHQGSQLLSVLTIPGGMTVIFFANPLIFAWTGKQLVADHTALIAALLTASAVLSALFTLPAALQLAYGWTSLGIWTGILSLCASVVLLLILINHFGAAGAASVGMITGIAFSPGLVIMHRRLLTSEARQWIFVDVGLPFSACAIAGWILARHLTFPDTRLGAVLLVTVSFALLSGVALLAAPAMRRQIMPTLRTALSLIPA